jgi:hypothetical protein
MFALDFEIKEDCLLYIGTSAKPAILALMSLDPWT